MTGARRAALAALALALALALPAAGQETSYESPAAQQEHPYESPRWGSFQLSFSGYHPNIDSEFHGSATPYATVFGNSRGLMFRADVAYSLFTGFGTLDAGIGAGYWEKYGKGLLPDGSVSSDSTGLRVIPSRVFLTYRFDWLAEHYPIPLAPYARISFERYWWWVTNGSGGTAFSNGKGGRGATNGYSLTGGIAFLLDFIDPTLARDMDRDTGINHTYLFVEFTKSYINNFGSAGSWDMSDNTMTVSGGLLFVF